jgi:hypothetical protein
MNGITDLERLTGLRYDAWTLNTDFDTPARHYLEHLAQSVVAAEVAEKKAGTIAPWDGAYAKASSRARTEFNNAHDWLTALVPSLPSGKGRYFP